MLKTQTIHARVSPELKTSAEYILNNLGMTVSQAITIFYRQIELHQGLPFSVSLNVPNKLTRETLEKSARGEDIVVCKDADDMFSKLGI